MANKLVSKLKNKHFLSLAGNGIMSVLGMVTIAILYRALSISDIGIWLFFLSTVLLVDTFRSGFITTAFIKFYAGATQKRNTEVVASTWVVSCIITGALVVLDAIAFLFIDKITDPGLVLFVKWSGITYVVTLPYFIATCVVQAEQRFDRLLYIRFINQGLFIILVAALIFTGNTNLQNIIYANLATSFVTSVFTIFTGWSRITSIVKWTRLGVADMYHFGKYSVGTTLSSNLFRSSDTFIINFMLGPGALAIYNLGQRLMEIIEIPLRSFAATGMPELSAAYNQNNKGKVIFTMQKYAGMLTMVLIPACLLAVIFADVAIHIIGGGKYVGTEAANVFRLFMIFALLYPLDRFMALTLDVIHQPKINFIKVLIMLAGNIIADFAGVYLFHNIYGVALATIVPTLIGVSIGFWALSRYQPFSIMSVYKVGYKELMILLRQWRQKMKKA